MSVARVLSRAQLGLAAPQVSIEVHLGVGLPGFSLVGLPAPVVRESRERVRAAILNSGFEFPPGRITVNLAPVELSKEGGRFDLPIALGLLLASSQVSGAVNEPFECYGELGLSGELKPVGGLFLAAMQAAAEGHVLMLPAGNLAEARLAGHGRAFGFDQLRDVCEALQTGLENQPGVSAAMADHSTIDSPTIQKDPFEAVKGQWSAKRAMVITAAGGHSLLMMGPPGSGKTLLAMCTAALLPPLTREQSLESACIASVSNGQLDIARWGQIPFRSPHHSASASAIVGGGPRLAPGEISLAHRGVLFLDELPEFDRRVLESLREPLESGTITLARAVGRLTLPADFQLIAAMNPCPCGFLGDPTQHCRCSPRAIQRYRGRISGPLLDRIDLRIEVPRPALADLVDGAEPDANSELPTAGVARARCRQLQRQGCLNSRLPPAQIASCCTLDRSANELLLRAGEQMSLSGRGLHRLLRVARTIADLADAERIGTADLAEAIQLRRPLPGGAEN